VLHQSAAHVVGMIPRMECFPVQPLDPGNGMSDTTRDFEPVTDICQVGYCQSNRVICRRERHGRQRTC
jgi:hypothetical protein